MKEPQWLSMVAKFHQLFDAPILDTPQIPSDRAQFRIDLLQEELNELKQAVADGDLVEVADALADLQYVLSGAVLEFGMGEKFADMFAAVQESNMSKACKSLEEAQATQKNYQEERWMEGRIVQKWNDYIVYRNSDDKVLKSINYTPVDLKPFVE